MIGRRHGWASLLGLLAAFTLQAQLQREYVLELRPESEADRDARHAWVASRRAGPAILVRRGATAAAPGNSLQACSIALDWGADGLIVDVRRTRDGVLVLFEDDRLDRLTHGIGQVGQITASSLLALPARESFGRPASGPCPSFVQLLDLARQRSALLHLELRQPGLEADVARWLDAADCWDHVVALDAEHAPRLARDPRLRLLRYKADLDQERQDLDAGAVRAALARPGALLAVQDPRVAASVLERPQYRPVPLVRTFRIVKPPEAGAGAAPSADFDPVAHLARVPADVNPGSALSLLGVLRAPPPPAPLPGSPADPATTQRRLAAWIVERAWASDRLGELGRRHRDITAGLEQVVRQRTAHPDPRYHWLDGALAARALGRLQVRSSVPVLVEAWGGAARTPVGPLPGLDEPGSNAGNGWWFQHHLLAALADLRCTPARRFLDQRLSGRMPERSATDARLVADTTRALLGQDLDVRDLLVLLRHPDPVVQGITLMECHDRPTVERRNALRQAAPWFAALPAARTVPPPPPRELPRVRAGVEASPKGAP